MASSTTYYPHLGTNLNEFTDARKAMESLQKSEFGLYQGLYAPLDSQLKDNLSRGSFDNLKDDAMGRFNQANGLAAGIAERNAERYGVRARDNARRNQLSTAVSRNALANDLGKESQRARLQGLATAVDNGQALINGVRLD